MAAQALRRAEADISRPSAYFSHWLNIFPCTCLYFLRLVDGLGFSPSGSPREGDAQSNRMAADLSLLVCLGGCALL